MMAPIHLLKRELWPICLVALFLYLALRTRQQSQSFEVTIENSTPGEVWEYVADFSNMKKLNPTILDFSITKEGGTYDQWHYSTSYTESLRFAPFIQPQINAHFVVKPVGETLLIQSTHTTCFLAQYLCWDAVSEYRFNMSKDKTGTKCVENVTYSCPYVLLPLCSREVSKQRQLVMNNLKKEFASKVPKMEALKM